jgi:hypothetical protein
MELNKTNEITENSNDENLNQLINPLKQDYLTFEASSNGTEPCSSKHDLNESKFEDRNPEEEDETEENEDDDNENILSNIEPSCSNSQQLPTLNQIGLDRLINNQRRYVKKHY